MDRQVVAAAIFTAGQILAEIVSGDDGDDDAEDDLRDDELLLAAVAGH